MKSVLTSLLILIAIVSLNAQSVSKEAVIQKVADKVCTCLNEELDFVGPNVQQVFIDLKDMSDLEADAYFEKMDAENPKLVLEVIEDSEQMSTDEVSQGIQDCIVNLENELSAAEQEAIGMDENAGVPDELMMTVVEKMTGEDCEFGKAVLEMGLREE